MDSTHSITDLLTALHAERPGAEDRLFERVHAELKGMAQGIVAGDRQGRIEGASAVVNEAYLRLADAEFENRRQLFSAYAKVMRRVLIDQARRRDAEKRGAGKAGLPLDEALLAPGGERTTALDAIAVDALLPRLQAASPDEADVIYLWYFGGIRQHAIATLLRCDERTVRRHLKRAVERMQGWLKAPGSDR